MAAAARHAAALHTPYTMPRTCAPAPRAHIPHHIPAPCSTTRLPAWDLWIHGHSAFMSSLYTWSPTSIPSLLLDLCLSYYAIPFSTTCAFGQLLTSGTGALHTVSTTACCAAALTPNTLSPLGDISFPLFNDMLSLFTDLPPLFSEHVSIFNHLDRSCRIAPISLRL